MDTLGDLRNPAHVGPNRCWPCTVLNVAILTVLALVASRLSPLLAPLVLLLGAAGIALRGYVIPFTPRFAPRLVATIPEADRLFPTTNHSRDDPAEPSHLAGTAGSLGDADADGEQVLAALVDAGIVVGDTDLAIADEFAAAWRDRMATIATQPTDELARAVAAAAPASVRTNPFSEDGREWIIATDPDETLASETWLSRPVAIADVAAVAALTDRGLPNQTAADAAPSLRLFLDSCPDCGGDVVETTGDGCCGGFGPGGPTHVLACTDCDQRLATLD